MRIGLFHKRKAGEGDLAIPDNPEAALYAYLSESDKHTVDLKRPSGGATFSQTPDLAFIWNGIRGRAESVRLTRAQGCPVVIMERGFFDRMRYTQLDRAVFNAEAAWASEIRRPAPADGAERFAAVWKRPRKVLRPRERGYILVLLQVPHDSQLRNSEIQAPKQLLQVIDAIAPPGIEIVCRSHPRLSYRVPPTCGIKPIGGTLEEAVAGARFVLTVN